MWSSSISGALCFWRMASRSGIHPITSVSDTGMNRDPPHRPESGGQDPPNKATASLVRIEHHLPAVTGSAASALAAKLWLAAIFVIYPGARLWKRGIERVC